MTNNLFPERERAFSDLLQGERRRTQEAVDEAQDIRSLLWSLAMRLDNGRLRAIQQQDPNAPSNWRAIDWRRFFGNVSAPTSWAVIEPAQEDDQASAELALLQAQHDAIVAERDQALQLRDNLQAEIRQLERQLQPAAKPRTETVKPAIPAEQELPAAPAPEQPIQAAPAGYVPSKGSLLIDLRAAIESAPECPSSWKNRVNGGKPEAREVEDARKAWRRKIGLLYLVGHWGINAKLELEHLVALVEGMKSNAGSLHRALDQLIEGDLLYTERSAMTGVSASLKLLRLTNNGRQLFRILFNADPVESEWERLNRMHEGQRFPNHTIGILIFTLHARVRGYETQILPPVENTKAVPDLEIRRGEEHLYVEVELSSKEHVSKWVNIAAINGGRVAICGLSTSRRERLVGDCKLKKLPGMATDIETLKSGSYEVMTEETPLWAETWK